jgi:hypothetical protein
MAGIHFGRIPGSTQTEFQLHGYFPHVGVQFKYSNLSSAHCIATNEVI